jgi:serine/threonine protein kinase
MFNSGDDIGPYTLLRKLGEGSFGVVWLAKNNSRPTQTQVALKTLRHPDANAILQEVFNWAKADGHPNILPILEAGVYPTPHGDIPLIVSSYMQEGSLRNWIEQHQPLSIGSAIEISCSILDGLEHLHRRRIVHRDLKPENVLVYQNTPLLTDFGIARFQQSDSDIQTKTIAGTVPYMAPEAFQGVRSPQTDVWSVAVICYEMLAGRRPFPPDMNMITGATPAPPLPLSAPRSLRKVLEFALRKDPILRSYKSAAELRAALLEFADTSQTQTQPTLETTQSSTWQMGHEERLVTERQEEAPSPRPASGNAQSVLDINIEKLRSDTIEVANVKVKPRQFGDRPDSPSVTKFRAGEVESKKFTLTGEEDV